MTNIPNTQSPDSSYSPNNRNTDLAGPPTITFQVDGQQIEVTLAQIRSQEYVAGLQAQASTASHCMIDASAILGIDQESRIAVLQQLSLLTQQSRSTLVSFSSGGQSPNLFQAGLLLLEQQGAPMITRVTDLLVEIAAITESDSGIRIRCSDIVEQLRRRGNTGLRASHFADQALRIRRQLLASHVGEGARLVLDVWETVPCSVPLRVPSAWSLTENGIESTDGGFSIPCRLLISRVYQNIESQNHSVELMWERRGEWLSHICEREQISNIAAIVKLATKGLPVTSNNATVIIGYLNDFERENLNILPCSRIANRMGWFATDGGHVFLCGHQPITRNQTPDDEQTASQLSFLGDDEGDERVAAGVHSHGDFNRWLEAIAIVQPCARVLMTFYASLATPLLHVVNAPNFVVSLDGRTSVGKTTAQMLAASVWGNPVLHAGDHHPVMRSWDTTPIFIERAAALCNGIPIIVDDTKVAKDTSQIVDTVYRITNGGGRGRGSVRGLAATRGIRTIMISSGEEPITSFSRDGGSHARVVGLWGSPFSGHADPVNGVIDLRELISENYGHAGPRFVQYLVDNQNDWPEWRDSYTEARRRYTQLAGTNTVASRMASYFAVLELAGHLAHSAIPIPFSYQDTIAGLWGELTAGADEADQGLTAMRFIIDWAHSQSYRFKGGPGSRQEAPHGGWLGRWKVQGTNRPECLAVSPLFLDDVLRNHGFSTKAVLGHWQENGWLQTNDTRKTLKISIDGIKSSAVAIEWGAIDQIMVGSELMISIPVGEPRGNSERTRPTFAPPIT
ncbi:MAG: DUF927 domain-containing protein [Planctomycetaceae bacterium]